MYCKECGKQISNDSNFCAGCGAKIFSDPVLTSEPKEDTKSFWKKLSEQVNEINTDKTQKKEDLKSRIKQMDKDGTAYCPKCYSSSLSANKKGFGIGKAVIGNTVAGPIGLIAGNAGAKKVRVTCLKCGYQFWAGKK